MVRDGGQPQPPVIVVLSADAGPIEREVLAGIEEEGVPYVVRRVDAAHRCWAATDLAQQAALSSPLQVGVGVGREGEVSVHHSKLAEPAPALGSAGVADQAMARTLGHNAARIVVGLPLKPVADNRIHQLRPIAGQAGQMR